MAETPTRKTDAWGTPISVRRGVLQQWYPLSMEPVKWKQQESTRATRPYPSQDVTGFVNILHALGKGIGNTAAHETGHHLEDYGATTGIGVFPNMDCGASPDNRLNPGVPCVNDDNFVYAFFNGGGMPQYGTTSNGAMFLYGIPGGTQGIPPQPAIHWGPSDICWLKNYTAPGSCKK